jgi:sugar lactone lactonase YvrE
LVSLPASAQVARLLIDETGDGAGHPLLGARGIALDAKGNVFVSGMLSQNVFRIAPDGKIVQVIGPDGDGAGHELREPRALAVDSKGNLYVGGVGAGTSSGHAGGGSSRSSTRAGTERATGCIARSPSRSTEGTTVRGGWGSRTCCAHRRGR